MSTLHGVTIWYGRRKFIRNIYGHERLESGSELGWVILPWTTVKEARTMVMKDKRSIRWIVSSNVRE